MQFLFNSSQSRNYKIIQRQNLRNHHPIKSHRHKLSLYQLHSNLVQFKSSLIYVHCTLTPFRSQGNILSSNAVACAAALFVLFNKWCSNNIKNDSQKDREFNEKKIKTLITRGKYRVLSPKNSSSFLKGETNGKKKRNSMSLMYCWDFMLLLLMSKNFYFNHTGVESQLRGINNFGKLWVENVLN